MSQAELYNIEIVITRNGVKHCIVHFREIGALLSLLRLIMPNDNFDLTLLKKEKEK